jgi:hypothetical protein
MGTAAARPVCEWCSYWLSEEQCRAQLNGVKNKVGQWRTPSFEPLLHFCLHKRLGFSGLCTPLPISHLYRPILHKFDL